MTYSLLLLQNGGLFWMVESEDASAERDYVALAQRPLALDLGIVDQTHGVVAERHQHDDAILVLQRAVVVENHVVVA